MSKVRDKKWQRREQAITQRAIATYQAKIATARKQQVADRIKHILAHIRAYCQQHPMALKETTCGLLIIALLPSISNPQQAIPFLAQAMAFSSAIITIWFAFATGRAALRRRFALIEDDPVVGFSFRATIVTSALALIISLLYLNFQSSRMVPVRIKPNRYRLRSIKMEESRLDIELSMKTQAVLKNSHWRWQPQYLVAQELLKRMPSFLMLNSITKHSYCNTLFALLLWREPETIYVEGIIYERTMKLAFEHSWIELNSAAIEANIVDTKIQKHLSYYAVHRYQVEEVAPMIRPRGPGLPMYAQTGQNERLRQIYKALAEVCLHHQAG